MRSDHPLTPLVKVSLHEHCSTHALQASRPLAEVRADLRIGWLWLLGLPGRSEVARARSVTGQRPARFDSSAGHSLLFQEDTRPLSSHRLSGLQARDPLTGIPGSKPAKQHGAAPTLGWEDCGSNPSAGAAALRAAPCSLRPDRRSELQAPGPLTGAGGSSPRGGQVPRPAGSNPSREMAGSSPAAGTLALRASQQGERLFIQTLPASPGSGQVPRLFPREEEMAGSSPAPGTPLQMRDSRSSARDESEGLDPTQGRAAHERPTLRCQALSGWSVAPENSCPDDRREFTCLGGVRIPWRALQHTHSRPCLPHRRHELQPARRPGAAPVLGTGDGRFESCSGHAR